MAIPIDAGTPSGGYGSAGMSCLFEIRSGVMCGWAVYWWWWVVVEVSVIDLFDRCDRAI
ncbi:MAG TPA: hypothetical protein VN229_18465 [Terriglobales bacterium]|nr:hypothetical protein [Terriglobales bacterium]